VARISRRALLLSPAAWLACGPRKADGYRGYCVVADSGGRSVAVVDLTSFRVRRRIALDAAPSVVVAHPSRPIAFVLAPDAGTVYEIDAASLAVTRRARAGNAAIGIEIAPRKDALWVLYRDPAALAELPLDTFRPGRRIRFDAPPDAFDLGAGNQAAVTFRQGRAIALASLDRARVENTISMAAEPSFVLFRSDGKALTAGNGGQRSLTIFELPGGKTIVRLPLAIEPRHFCVSQDGGQVFLSGEGMDAVAILFPYDTEIWQTVLAGRAPGALAVSDTRPPYLLVANPDTSSVTVLNADTETLAARVEVGQRPCQIVVTPDQKWALVLNAKSGDMAVIRLLSLDAAQSARVLHYRTAPIFTMVPVGENPVGAAVVGW
jgi:YVTN family beta-propeller protein